MPIVITHAPPGSPGDVADEAPLEGTMNRKIVTSGLLAGLVAGGGAGFILQQGGFAGASNSPSAVIAPDTTTSDPATTDPATTDPATSGPARPDPGARAREVLQPLVDDGTLTAAQLDAVVSALEAAGPPAGGRPAGTGDHRGPGGPGDRGPGDRGRGGRGFGLDAAATAIGITADDLRTALQGGSTIAAVAADNGVDVQTVIDAIVAEQTANVTARVTAGDLTQAQADAEIAELPARVTDLVNNVRPTRPQAAPAAPDAAPATADAASS
jgi:hypothetical protein